jgi:hypothetical protein
MKKRINVLIAGVTLALLIGIFAFPTGSSADHSWGNYHWARTSNPFNLKVIDSNSDAWDDNLDRALTDWSGSTVLDLTKEAGDDALKARKRCAAVTGKVRSCNAEYGFNQWLGLASISLSGSHITRGTAKMNDSYFNSSRYNETARQQVMCQEIGHTFGLDHQDESGADLNTCMDYSNDLDNPSPNNHDMDQLLTIYRHEDSTTTVSAFGVASNPYEEDPDLPHNWGQLVRQSANGRSSLYERDLGEGNKKITYVFWTQEAADRCPACDHRYDH